MRSGELSSAWPAIVLLIIFFISIVRSMVPLSKIDAVPSVDRYTHMCTVCGLKDAHMWRCITWFIGVATKFYRENLVSLRKLLKKLDENQHVTSNEVKDAIEKLDYLETLGTEVLKDEQKRT